MTEPKATKAEQTRQRILDAAAKTFRLRGYSNARLTDIAEAAGLQTGSIYYHFDSREALVQEVLRMGVVSAWEHVKTSIEGLPADATPLERVATAIRAHTAMQLELSDYSSAHSRIIGQVPPEVRRRHVVMQINYGEFWNDLLESAVESGEMRRDVDLFVVRMLILGALNWSAEWYRPTTGRSAQFVANQAVELVLHGLAVGAAEDRAVGSPDGALTAPIATERESDWNGSSTH